MRESISCIMNMLVSVLLLIMLYSVLLVSHVSAKVSSSLKVCWLSFDFRFLVILAACSLALVDLVDCPNMNLLYHILSSFIFN